MRLLLAGALGEVGASLGRALEALGYEMVLVSSRARCEGRPDVVGISDAVSLVSSGQVHAIVNASGPGDRRSQVRHVGTTSDEIAAAASRVGIPAVLLSTTRVLEGDQDSPEEDASPSPLSPYAMANAEHETQWLAHPSTQVLRLVNFFGVPQSADSPQSELLPWSLLTEGWVTERITVRSGPKSVKDFVNASDVANALELIFRSLAGPRVMATIPGARLSMQELAHASSVAISTAGRSEPLVSFGQDNAASSPPVSGWLADQGWACRATLAEMTQAMTGWLIEWGDRITRTGVTRGDG